MTTNNTSPEPDTATRETSGQGLDGAICSASFVMPFGKYKGKTLDDISDDDPSYVVWLADEKVLKIKREFLDAVRQDDMESDMWSAFESWPHD
jgi:uncharacterized protein (DUF3820 family)